MSKCVIFFIILIAVQVIYSKAQEGTRKIPTFEKKHEGATQTPNDSAQEYITLEFSIIEKILDYSMQKLSESRVIPRKPTIGGDTISRIYKSAKEILSDRVQEFITLEFSIINEIHEYATQKLNNFNRFFATPNTIGLCNLIEKYNCAMHQGSDNVKRGEELESNERVKRGEELESNERAQKCMEELEEICECTDQIPNETQGCIEKLEEIIKCTEHKPNKNHECTLEESIIENVIVCAEQNPHHKCVIDRKQDYSYHGIKNRVEL